MQDGIRAVQQAFGQASPAPRWPMYVRQAKQFLKTHIDGFRRAQVRIRVGRRSAARRGKEGVLSSNAIARRLACLPRAKLVRSRRCRLGRVDETKEIEPIDRGDRG